MTMTNGDERERLCAKDEGCCDVVIQFCQYVGAAEAVFLQTFG